MGTAVPPKALVFAGNVAENWREWKQQFKIFMIASKKNKEAEIVQCNLFLNHIGPDSVKIYNTFEIDEDKAEEFTLKKLLAKFDTHCKPLKNITVERHNFFCRDQGENESIDAYVTELRTKADTCEFYTLKEDKICCSLRDSLIKDRIVCGIRCDKVRERLLQEPNLTLKTAMEICHAAESSKSQMQTLNPDSKVDAVEKSMPKRLIKDCKYCGGSHPPRRCPAYGKECKECGRVGHYERVCMSKESRYSDRYESRHSSGKQAAKNGTKRRQNQKVDALDEDDDDDSVSQYALFADELKVHSMENPTIRKMEWKARARVLNHTVTFKLDTGAQANILSKSLYRQLNPGKDLTHSKVRLTTYSGGKIKVLGKFTECVEYKNRLHPVEFLVVDIEAQPILGLQACEEMNLIKRVDAILTGGILDEYPELFKGMGCIAEGHKIHIKEDAQGVVHPPRKMPVSMREPLKKELERCEKLGVVSKVTEPTEWVNSLVIVPKANGKIRICMDPKNLNEAVKRQHYPLPTAEDIMSRLTGAKIFSILDAASGFWQIKLDAESAKLCTFNTPFGRYRFERLPFGIKTGSEAFHQKAIEFFEGLDGVEYT
jgi:hypothetical protein